MIGTTVGKYRIVEKLGRGGMGTVYKAVDETLDRDVAIKVLNPDLTDQSVLKRFRAEAVTLARLNHPGIATIYELHHHHDDELLMVMEFVRGETFHDLSDRLGPLAPPQAAHLCMQVLDALAHAHRGGVVHRDLKPANLMITDSGCVKVMDFGIARVLGSEHFTHGGYMMGTPAYMAPEQVLGREIDGRADLYSVGVVLYRLLSGRLPFNADTAISMVQMQISEPPTPIVTFKPDLPSWCTTIMDRALAKSPSDRFQSAEEFRSALLATVTPQALGEMPTLSTPTPPGIAIEPDVTMPHRTPTRVVRSAAIGASGAQAAAAAVATVTPPPVAVSPTPTNPTPTNMPLSERTTTTVVLGRNHLFVLAALVVIVVIGIAVLAVVAFRRGPAAEPSQAAVTQPKAPEPTQAAAPAPSALPPPPTQATPPQAAPPQTTAATANKPAAPAATTPSASERTVATVGATPVPPKPPGRGASNVSVSSGASPTDAGAAGRAGRSGAKEATPPPAAAPPSVPPPPAATPTAASASFNQVRLLVSDGGRAREREGILQIGDGRVAIVATAGNAPMMSVPFGSLSGVFYSRGKQPKWRDASGQEVVSRIDLGPMGFLRGERNWIILLTGGEPVILRIEDNALRTVLPALQEHTGLKIQR
jgi:serine/threonine-protein kinase